MVAGLEQPTSGRILLGLDDITTRRPYKRPINTVFQSYALFPHLDVFENVAFGLRRRGIRSVRAQVEEMLELVELRGYARQRPAQLSGGQQQRVALARALINRPQVLLLDEPLGALDLKLRRQMQTEIKRIQTEVGLTFVRVTHDQEEAMTMADTIAVMSAGRVEQLGKPTELYESPATTFVANFLGRSNLVRPRVTACAGGDLVLDVAGQPVVVPASRVRSSRTSPGDELWMGVRPEKLALATPGATATSSRTNALSGTVVDAAFVGVSTDYTVETPAGHRIWVFAQNSGTAPALRPGDPVVAHWDPAHTFALDVGEDGDAGVVVDGLETTVNVSESAPTAAVPAQVGR